MNDNYWVVQENCKDLFKDKNLYHNSFNTNIASIAFTDMEVILELHLDHHLNLQQMGCLLNHGEE